MLHTYNLREQNSVRVSIASYYFRIKTKLSISIAILPNPDSMKIHPQNYRPQPTRLHAQATTPTPYDNEASSDEAPIDERHLAMRHHLRRPAPMPQRQRRSTASAFMHDVLEGAHHVRDAA